MRRSKITCAAAQIGYQYVKLRKQFGRQPRFTDTEPQVRHPQILEVQSSYVQRDAAQCPALLADSDTARGV